jgi:hypothetical protein
MSQDNITWTCASAASTYRMREGSEVIVSFLPFSHIVAQVKNNSQTLQLELSYCRTYFVFFGVWLNLQ